MNELQDYLKEKLNEVKKTYNAEYHLNSYFDRELKRQWKIDYERTRAQWQSVKSIADVKRYVNGFVGNVKQYKNVRGLFSDAYDMDLALYRAISAIQKMAQCYDMDDFDFRAFGKEEIDDMFSVLYKWIEEMRNVNMRRAMQD